MSWRVSSMDYSRPRSPTPTKPTTSIPMRKRKPQHRGPAGPQRFNAYMQAGQVQARSVVAKRSSARPLEPAKSSNGWGPHPDRSRPCRGGRQSAGANQCAPLYESGQALCRRHPKTLPGFPAGKRQEDGTWYVKDVFLRPVTSIRSNWTWCYWPSPAPRAIWISKPECPARHRQPGLVLASTFLGISATRSWSTKRPGFRPFSSPAWPHWPTRVCVSPARPAVDHLGRVPPTT